MGVLATEGKKRTSSVLLKYSEKSQRTGRKIAGWNLETIPEGTKEKTVIQKEGKNKSQASGG